ncbi:MAG: M6 family metalloprotease domain-containing protein [Bacteroidales bacterium]|nr:M6 family metalloprotease domain-containing protein [Bacteroidales bacterium]
MKKTLIALCASVFAVSSMMAVPVKPGKPIVHTQSDGTTIEVSMRGDEFHHSFVTADGITVAQAENGDFYYSNAAGITERLAHSAALRSADEKTWVASQASNMTLSSKARANAKRKAVAQKAPQVPGMGSPKIPILLIQYSDKKMSNTKEAFERMYSTDSKSVKQYFVDQSRGKFSPQYDLYGIYTLASTRATYGGNDRYGDDKGVARMVAEACQKAEADGINWKDYDNDGDGQCDVVIVVYAGVGEAQAYGVVPNAVWPCQWELSDAAQFGDGPGALTYDGVKIDKFAVFNETRGSNDNATKLDGIGTFCHEFSHCLGLPDFYDTQYSGKYFGMGDWSLLDGGCYNDDGDTPCAFTAYEKNFMNWMELSTPVANTQYTLDATTASDAKAYKVVNDRDPNEYYILENRQLEGWDAALPSHGLQVTHVTFSQSAWDQNVVNNYALQRMTLIPADGQLKMNTSTGAADPTNMKGDLYPYNGNNALTDESSPAAKVNTGTYMSKPITEITEANGKVSFWFMKEAMPKTNPVLTEATDVAADAFTAHWTAGENAKSYTLFVKNADIVNPSELLLESNFKAGLPEGWSKSSSGTYEDADYFRLGTNKANGTVTSPAVDITDQNGTATVKITALPYATDDPVVMRVSLLDASGQSQSQTDVTLESAEKEYAVVLNGGGTGSKVKIENTTMKKRVMMANVKIYSGDASEAADARRKAEESGDANTRTITGITDTLYTVTGLTPGANYTYKVKAIFLDDTEGAWSEAKTVKLNAAGIKGDVNGDGNVDVGDVTALVNKILGAAEYSDAVCDINEDGEVNVSDVTSLIAIILQL